MSNILANILGLYFLGMGLAFFLNPSRFKRVYQLTIQDESFIFYGGILALIIGATIVSLHNIWMWAWPTIITVLGWWSLIKGFALMLYPDFVQCFSFLQNRSNMFYRILSAVWIALGLFLIYKAREQGFTFIEVLVR